MELSPKIKNEYLKHIDLSLSPAEFMIIRDSLNRYSQNAATNEVDKLMAWRMVEKIDKYLEQWKERYLKGE